MPGSSPGRRRRSARRGAWRDFRIGFQTFGRADRPALVLLATDGYANAFREDAGFLQVGTDLLAMIREEGLQHVAAGLETWLAEASDSGSGDDVTLGLLCRRDAVAGNAPAGQGVAAGGRGGRADEP